MKILVVEDDRTVGQYVKRGLEEQRYQADLVDDGMEGLRLASGGRYDIIVLDLRLPGMNGFEMLRTLRDRGNTTPVLVLTAQDSVDFKVQALRAGADDYVHRPFTRSELLARAGVGVRSAQQRADDSLLRALWSTCRGPSIAPHGTPATGSSSSATRSSGSRAFRPSTSSPASDGRS
jgi:two-component system copper resistance phosphate regulon response regulator CusR